MTTCTDAGCFTRAGAANGAVTVGSLALEQSRLQAAAAQLDQIRASRALIDPASEEAAEALTELRELARGTHSAVLTQTGLRGASRPLGSIPACSPSCVTPKETR